MTELVLVKAADCRPLRHEVLRPEQPVEACEYPDDDLDTSVHLAVKDGKRTVGVLSMYRHERDGLGSEVWRVRGMAVPEDERRKGHGRQLLLAAQAVAEKRGGGMWCNARSTAAPFYQAFGFEVLGDEFEIEGIGPHVIMTWRPQP